MTELMPEELREVTPRIWDQYPPNHPLLIDMFAVVIFILLAINVFGNSLVIYIFCAEKSLRTPVRRVRAEDLGVPSTAL